MTIHLTPDAIDLWATDSSSSDDMGKSLMPYHALSGSEPREIQNKFVMDSFWKQFVERRRLNFDCLRFVVHHHFFSVMVGLFLLLNGLYVGVVANYNVQRIIHHLSGLHKKVSFEVETPQWECGADVFFASVFAVEIVMRVLGEELVFFFGDHWRWNWVDFVLAATPAVEVVTDLGRTHRLFRLIRVFRLVRTVRVLDFLRVFGKFRLLVLAIQQSVVPLTWAIMLIAGLLYLASLIFLDGVSEYLMSGATDREVVGALEQYFANLHRTLLTLFMCSFGGISWESVIDIMMNIHGVYGLIFVLFIASMMLAALNIIAGIFVNDAIEMASDDREVVSQAEAQRDRAIERELKHMFMEFDTDNSGTLTMEEFTHAMEHPEVQARFRHLGLDFTDARSIFEMLDISDKDALAIKEFIIVCLRAKSLTRPLDHLSFLQERRRFDQRFRNFFANLDGQLGKLTEQMDKLLAKSQSKSMGS